VALLHADCRSARGVALASVLLHDDHSPLYTAFADTTVGALARSATATITAEPDDALAG